MVTLYDDSESSEGEAGAAFAVNKDFAAKYEQKKRTEELSKLQDKYGADWALEDEEEDNSEDLSSDDSDAELVTPAVDVAILRTLARIRKRDPAVYEEDRQVFDEEEQRSASTSTTLVEPSKSSKLGARPVLLKDYQRSRLLADPTGSNDGPSATDFLPTFAQEERALKAEVTKAFHTAGEDGSGEDDDDLLVPRTKTKEEREREDAEYAEFLKANVGDREVEDALEQEEKFLREYILNRGWIDRSGNKSRIPSYNEITGGDSPPPERKRGRKDNVTAAEAAVEVDKDEGDIPDPGQNDSEDSEFEERAEEFEHKYNFRFEEEAGPAILTHARDLSTSVRRPTATVTARARQRDLAKERREEEKLQRKEEVRRLKALKRKEVEEKLLKIVEAAGQGTAGLEGIDLEGDWDPEEHDRKMAEVYGEGYGEADDIDFKPTWDDDIDISDLQAAEDAEVVAGEAEEAVYDPSELPVKGKKDKKGKRKRDEEGFPADLVEAAKNGADDARKALIEKLTDEYYGLDYEDKIGDLPTRFKYAKVEASSYSLTPAEILLATDAELNSYMSLRKMAPYRVGGSKESKGRKKLKELRDALKHREWGVEVDEEAEKVRRERKSKWIEEGTRRKQTQKGDEGGTGTGKEGPAKRVGKKERQRRKLAAQASADA